MRNVYIMYAYIDVSHRWYQYSVAQMGNLCQLRFESRVNIFLSDES